MQNLLEICNITLEDLRELYAKERSIYRIQKYLGVSRPTVTKWLRIAGVKTLGHRPVMKPTSSMEGEFGMVSKWIQSHPDEKLPRSMKLAAEKIGCSAWTLRSYLYRRRKRIIKYLESFGDLRKLEVIITTVDGKNINTRYVTEYKYKFNPKTYAVSLNVKINETMFSCQYTFKVFLTILKKSRILIS